MSFTFIADPTYIRNYGIIRQSVSDAIISPAAKLVQFRYIAPYVDYVALITAIKNDTLTLDQTALLDDYLRPAMANYVSAWLAQDLNAQIGGNGTGGGNSESFFVATEGVQELRYLQLMRAGDFYLNAGISGGNNASCAKRIKHAPGLIVSKRGCCDGN